MAVRHAVRRGDETQHVSRQTKRARPSGPGSLLNRSRTFAPDDVPAPPGHFIESTFRIMSKVNHQQQSQAAKSHGTTKPTGFIEQQILRTLTTFHEPGSVVEIRILGIPGRGRPHSASGYFTDFRKAAEAVTWYDEHRAPSGFYFVMNCVNPALLARSPERLTDYPESTTSDADIVRRQWLLIDIDPDRPKGIPSSDDELEAARIVAGNARDWLRDECGWFEPVEAMSGNGWHLLFPVNLPNDEDATRTMKAVLNAVAARFGGDRTPAGLSRVTVDTSVFNASRITKLYGTIARKGHGIEGRPLRLSVLRHVPEYLDPQHKEGGQGCLKQ